MLRFFLVCRQPIFQYSILHLLGHKLLSDVENQVTLYIDPHIKNEFMKHAKHDLEALVKSGQNGVKETASEVRNILHSPTK